ncbi:hypothetical protein P4O66_011359 [Electrophorus voltai]|uniref:Rho-GAP domain-containing protein n=1 Tax=Electrophorus voltai TaxID=2609070 RepID=A0AAD9DT92_9TELE|nr:hypothetical protein P4O66_011359 [Electrophorus voltai]
MTSVQLLFLMLVYVYVAGKTDAVLGSSSSSVPTSAESELPVEDVVRHTQITVSKKQNWAKLSAPGCPGPQRPAFTTADGDGCSGKAQAWKQAWSCRTPRGDSLEGWWKEPDAELGYFRASRASNGGADTGSPESAPPASEFRLSPCVAKLSGQGAYLQHLERSSRAWVLSTGKPQAPDEAYPACLTDWKRVAEGESNIWYNPIPEEEDARAGGTKPREESRDPWKRKETGGSPEERRACAPLAASATGRAQAGAEERKESSNNVISRYHLDSSAPARPRRRSSRTHSTGKGGYLSDGDSPELLPKQGSGEGSPPPPPRHGGQDAAGVADAGSFRLYTLEDQPRCAQRVSGLLTVHLLGAEELARPPRSDASKDVFCAIQVDGVTRARTSLLACRGACLPLNHTFNLELERARLLKLVVLTPTVTAAAGASRTQQLCVKLDPRGLLYVKLTLLEQWDVAPPCLRELLPPAVFGVELRLLVAKEGCNPKVPLIIQKCVGEIEKRGLKVVGLYRLCGSAAVKKDLRDAFERDSAAVSLSEDLYPDINVVTGILKDYLRELPSPLITRTLYEVVLQAMRVRPATEHGAQSAQGTVSLLQCLPAPERVWRKMCECVCVCVRVCVCECVCECATLSLLLDHLSLVAYFSHCNLMTCQNLAVCFGPVLLTPTQESWRAGLGGRGLNTVEITSAVDFKRHIEALHYLLQLWPIPAGKMTAWSPYSPELSSVPPPSQNSLQHRKHCAELPPPQDVAVVSRRGRGRLESPPCNRYAGDWTVCGRDLAGDRSVRGRDFLSDDVDYDEVAGSESDEDDEEEDKTEAWVPSSCLYSEDFALDFDAPFTCRLSLKDFDNLISDLERELAKQINICL